jgi:hypothetical protein
MTAAAQIVAPAVTPEQIEKYISYCVTAAYFDAVNHFIGDRQQRRQFVPFYCEILRSDLPLAGHLKETAERVHALMAEKPAPEYPGSVSAFVRGAAR